ncbi:MAG: anthranilate phosphoribosyltransferase [Lewinellaceae bacterium]|nr:anthranilate phosphoribosyltransferase [Lewinella sp.]MCB9279147.1 anthranilate phosphoribosyltransferase [Lewinellaceae bacterium]
MKSTLSRLFDHQLLSREEARDILLRISGAAFNPVQIASFVSVFNMRPVSIPELQGFRDALLELCVKVDVGGQSTIDIVGTGGDGKNTFNISTLSAITVAGAGYKVTKHGSYGVSSSVGSSDVLMALGYRFSNDNSVLLRQLERANICFLHAPLFHPALKEVAPVRKDLGMKTFFNMLGPLVNPIQPSHQLFGTFSLELQRLYQYLLQESDRRFIIVYALDGYDEVSLTGPFKIAGNGLEKVLHPEDLDLPVYTQPDLDGGQNPEEGAKIFRDVLENKGTKAQMDTVSANAGLAIHCFHPERSLKDCIAEARESLESGRALGVLKTLLEQ